MKDSFVTKCSVPGQSRFEMPEIRFTGQTDKVQFTGKNPLLAYLFSVLRNKPQPCPPATRQEWQEVFSVLNSHFIMPLLYCCMRRLDSALQPPEEMFTLLRNSFLASQSRVIQMEGQLAEIASCFDGNDLRYIVLKGPALARTVYPHPATRPSSDLDLLVQPCDVRRARELLKGLGYRCLGERFDFARDFYNDELFIKNNRHFRQIELHWALHRFAGIASDMPSGAFFDHAVRVDLPLSSFLSLDIIDSLIHRCISNNYDKDREMRLIWLTDIAYLCNSITASAQWEELRKRSVQASARLAVEFALRTADKWIGFDLPLEFADFNTWPEPAQMEKDAWDKLRTRHNRLADMIRLHLSSGLSISQRIRYFFHLLFPTPQSMRLSYKVSSSWQLPAAYIRRWLKWLRGI